MRHLKAFYTFHIAAASTSYREAADKLSITHGAVSKQIKVLESYLDQPLFYRQGRNVYLTKEGELLKGYTEQAFQILEQGVERVRHENRQCLEVSCEPTLTMRWLMPRLSEFHRTTHGDVRLSTAGGPVILGVTGLSMAIRRDDFELHHAHQKIKLVEEWVGPVFAPKYWQSVNQDHSKIVKLHSESRRAAWKTWLGSAASHLDFGHNEQFFDHFYFCFQAAIDGLGAAMGSYPLVVDDLKQGRLVAPFGFIRSDHDYVLLKQEGESTLLEDQFTTWLQNALAECVPQESLRKI
ncbi:LysR family transcriptional regulator [Shewanella sp. VB17]|uniref:LysR family transcriptional regulator n=1 Tax=Shewanella sp. VB17 TaxID=2739432 RepID=UPI0015643890|nr:LysR family transcriptional regulator [Shewanella sp. VB17]NRD75397.1 LysR family transcriptional regulator [Shewanella sp. VB17]